MADIIPLAIGIGKLTIDQTYTMTPAEILEHIEAMSKQHRRDLEFFDLWNARHYSLYSAAHGVENTKPSDYLLFPKDEKEEKGSKVPVMGDSPEVIESKLKMLAVSMGGLVDQLPITNTLPFPQTIPGGK